MQRACAGITYYIGFPTNPASVAGLQRKAGEKSRLVRPPAGRGTIMEGTWLDEAPEEVFGRRKGKDLGGEEENIEHRTSYIEHSTSKFGWEEGEIRDEVSG